MPRLRELEAEFLHVESPTSHRRIGDKLTAEAHGIFFLCPLCWKANGGPIGTHGVICWFVGVDPSLDPKPGRWTPTGTSLDDLSFVPGGGRSNSVLLLTGCKWHGFVTNGSAD